MSLLCHVAVLGAVALVDQLAGDVPLEGDVLHAGQARHGVRLVATGCRKKGIKIIHSRMNIKRPVESN